jgi:hypothetical protein
LLDEGYDLALIGNHLIVRKVPYVTAERVVMYGCLAYPVTVSCHEIKDESGDHRIWFIGEQPCDQSGKPLPGPSPEFRAITPALSASYMISSKPKTGSYTNQYEKVASYVRILSHPAMALDSSVTATPGAVLEEVEDGLPFVYPDTASSRAGLAALNNKFRGQKIGIVGLGGTGSYILDQVAKTWVDAIELFDGDVFDNHNAFRAPSAADIEDLKLEPNKAEYFAGVYSQMHTGITAHPIYIDRDNLELLAVCTFVFVAAADADEKPEIIAWLGDRGIPCIDVGMGIRDEGGHLSGLLRATSRFPEQSAGVLSAAPERAGVGLNEYDRNIQTADLNSLNAVLAVINSKKYLGYYADHTSVLETVYKIYTGEIRNAVTES